VGTEILTWDAVAGGTVRLALDARDPATLPGWRATASSPTEGVVATTGIGDDGRLWIRTVTEDGLLRVVPGTAQIVGEPFGISFTGDGRLLNLFVADGDISSDWRVVQVDPVDGTQLGTGMGGTVMAPAGDLRANISTDTETAVVWASDQALPVTMLDVGTGRQLPLPRPTRDAVADSYRALSSGTALFWDDGTATLYDEAGTVVQDLEVERSSVFDVALAPDGMWGATVGTDGTVLLWDVDPYSGRWTQRAPLIGHDGDVVAADIDAEGRRLITASWDDTVIAWDVTPAGGFGAAYPVFPGRRVTAPPAVVAPGRLMVAPTRAVTGPVADPGIELAVPGTVDVATFFDPGTGAVVDEVAVGQEAHPEWREGSVAVSPDGRLVAVISAQSVTILDARSRGVLQRIVLPAHGGLDPNGEPLTAELLLDAVWTPDGSRLLVGTRGDWPSDTGGQLVVLSAETWREEDRLDVGISPIALEISPDERWLAVASAGSGEIAILDQEALRVRERLELGTNDRPWDVTFSPDGRLLAAAGQFGNVYVAETTNWELRPPVTVHDELVFQVEWLRDNRTVVTASQDGTVALLDIDRALVRDRPLEPADELEYQTLVLPQPDEELVVLAADRTGRRYPTDPESWLQEACDVVGRDLARAEWDRYLPGRPWAPTCTDLD
jgi:WD40 repeat protein